TRTETSQGSNTGSNPVTAIKEKRRRVETSRIDVEQRRRTKTSSRTVRPHRLTVRTPLFQGGNRSSILLGGKSKKTSRRGVTRGRHATTSRKVVGMSDHGSARRFCVTSLSNVFA